jgi:hypothetical protein
MGPHTPAGNLDLTLIPFSSKHIHCCLCNLLWGVDDPLVEVSVASVEWVIAQVLEITAPAVRPPGQLHQTFSTLSLGSTNGLQLGHTRMAKR